MLGGWKKIHAHPTASEENWQEKMSLIYAQLTHAIGLNDICDGLRLHNGPLVTLRGATPPSRNNLSHANKGIREITSRYQGRSRHRFGGLPLEIANSWRPIRS